MLYLYFFTSTLILACLMTIIVRQLAWRWQILDIPGGRRQHAQPTPLLGGLAVGLVLLIMLGLALPYLTLGSLESHHWLGVLFGIVCLLVGGILDDKFNLPARWQIVWPFLASLAVMAGGVGVSKLTNPFGGLIVLDQGSIFSLVNLLTLLWLMGMMYTTKLLDGLDGLVSGLTVIGSLVILVFTMTTRYYQPDMALAATILAGAFGGFWWWNKPRARIFLGESGSLLAGFMLGVLSIIAGGKIAIALLIMGLPILDMAWTIVRRLLAGHNPFKTADRQHLHFRLLVAGWNQWQTLSFFYLVSILCGLAALFLQSRGKLLALGLLALLMLILIVYLHWLDKNKANPLN